MMRLIQGAATLPPSLSLFTRFQAELPKSDTAGPIPDTALTPLTEVTQPAVNPTHMPTLLGAIEVTTSGFKWYFAGIDGQGQPVQLRQADGSMQPMLAGMDNTWMGNASKPFEERVTHFRKALAVGAQQFEDAQKQLGGHPILKMQGIATALWRKEAQNPAYQGLLKEVQTRFKLEQPVEIITGDREAALFYKGTYSAVLNRHPEWQGQTVLALDPGGKSIEFALGNNETPTMLKSIDFGESDDAIEAMNKTFDLKTLQYIRQVCRDRVDQAFAPNSADRQTLENTDHLIWGFAQSQTHPFRDILKKDTGLDLFSEPVPKEKLEHYLSSQQALSNLEKRLQARCEEMGNTRPYLKENARHMGTNLATMLGLMDSLKQPAVEICDGGGPKAGLAAELLTSFHQSAKLTSTLYAMA